VAAKKSPKSAGPKPKVPFGGKKAAPFKKGGGRVQKGAQ